MMYLPILSFPLQVQRPFLMVTSHLVVRLADTMQPCYHEQKNTEQQILYHLSPNPESWHSVDYRSFSFVGGIRIAERCNTDPHTL